MEFNSFNSLYTYLFIGTINPQTPYRHIVLMNKLILYTFSIILFFPIVVARAENSEYLSKLLFESLKGYSYVAYIKITKYEEKDSWGAYKIWKIKAKVLKNYKGLLPNEICMIEQAEPPYPQVPFIPKTIIISFPKQESECIGMDVVNIFPAEKKYFDIIHKFINNNTQK